MNQRTQRFRMMNKQTQRITLILRKEMHLSLWRIQQTQDKTAGMMTLMLKRTMTLMILKDLEKMKTAIGKFLKVGLQPLQPSPFLLLQ
jgi:hypothetical protein